jgi:hypothetical protein
MYKNIKSFHSYHKNISPRLKKLELVEYLYKL